MNSAPAARSLRFSRMKRLGRPGRHALSPGFCQESRAPPVFTLSSTGTSGSGYSCLVDDEALLAREVEARRAEDVVERRFALADVAAGVHRGRRDDDHRRGRHLAVVVRNPCAEVRPPGVAHVVHPLAVQRQRGLLEVVVPVRAQLAWCRAASGSARTGSPACWSSGTRAAGCGRRSAWRIARADSGAACSRHGARATDPAVRAPARRPHRSRRSTPAP